LPQSASSRRKHCDPATCPLASKLLGAPAGSPVLVLWLNQVTSWFCGEPPQTPCADFGREPLPCTSSSRRLCLTFLATMRPAIDLVRPPGPSSQAYLSTPRRPRKAKTFRACSSPASMQIKPQPAPAILGHESVHTTLSITHHTRERPSTGPRTLRSSPIELKTFLGSIS
jgi:hypothetical protein